eukprot:m.4453 g.4453  ORF g.4453 m.4453 type:complete len:461 (+) comp1904_c0_seq1:1-1383(+)
MDPVTIALAAAKVVPTIATLLKELYDKVDQTKQNRKQAELLVEHVRFVVDEHLLKNPSLISDKVQLALQKVLEDALLLVSKHDCAGRFKRLITDYKSKFELIHLQLDLCDKKFNMGSWAKLAMLQIDLQEAAKYDREAFEAVKDSLSATEQAVIEADSKQTLRTLIAQFEAFSAQWAECRDKFPNGKIRPESGINAALAQAAGRASFEVARGAGRASLKTYNICLDLDSAEVQKYLKTKGHAEALGVVALIAPLDALNHKQKLKAKDLVAMPLDNWGAVLLHTIDAGDRVHLDVLERCFSDIDADTEPFSQRDAEGIRNPALSFLEDTSFDGMELLVQQYKLQACTMLHKGAWLAQYNPNTARDYLAELREAQRRTPVVDPLAQVQMLEQRVEMLTLERDQLFMKNGELILKRDELIQQRDAAVHALAQRYDNRFLYATWVILLSVLIRFVLMDVTIGAS